MSEEWSIQYSFRCGGAMVNLRADSDIEAAMMIGELSERAVQVAELQALLDASYAAAAGLKNLPQANQQGQSDRQPQVSAAPASAGTAPKCDHGVWGYKSGTTKAGIPFEAWVCPADKEGGCKWKFISFDGKPSRR